MLKESLVAESSAILARIVELTSGVMDADQDPEDFVSAVVTSCQPPPDDSMITSRPAPASEDEPERRTDEPYPTSEREADNESVAIASGPLPLA